MKEYVATFYSHFAALLYYQALKKQGNKAKLQPVPREISASCGSSVFFQWDQPEFLHQEELEGIYLQEKGVWQCVYVNE